MEKTSYRAKLEPSDNEYGVWGHYNRFGGFHGTTDPYAYIGLLWLAIRSLRHPKVSRYILRMMWRRWVHRRCDTLDFHHEIYCTLDPYGKRLDDNYKWHKTWTS